MFIENVMYWSSQTYIRSLLKGQNRWAMLAALRCMVAEPVSRTRCPRCLSETRSRTHPPLGSQVVVGARRLEEVRAGSSEKRGEHGRRRHEGTERDKAREASKKHGDDEPGEVQVKPTGWVEMLAVHHVCGEHHQLSESNREVHLSSLSSPDELPSEVETRTKEEAKLLIQRKEQLQGTTRTQDERSSRYRPSARSTRWSLEKRSTQPIWECDSPTCRLWETQGSKGEQQDKAKDLPWMPSESIGRKGWRSKGLGPENQATSTRCECVGKSAYDAFPQGGAEMFMENVMYRSKHMQPFERSK